MNFFNEVAGIPFARLAVATLVTFGSYMAAMVVLRMLHSLLAPVSAGFDNRNLRLQSSDTFTRLLHRLGARFEPMGHAAPRYLAWTDQKMVYAGRPFGGISAARYIAAFAILGLLLGLIIGGVLIGAWLSGSAGPRGIILGFIFIFGMPILTVLLAGLVVRGEAAKVGASIVISFPYFLDLAVLVIQAGGQTRDTFREYIHAAPNSELSRELRVLMREADAIPIEDALLRLADRIEAPTIKTILRNLSQAQRSSGNLSAFYAEQAGELRSIRWDIAERAINAMQPKLKIAEFTMVTGGSLTILASSIATMGGMF
ncbi:MAG: hypothetical protein ABJM18_06910 [Hyphomonas sp.]|uniref:hypothetical protein n=1 Tax=Hyphomonas sp. TaxID=87 RepID=UPI003296DEB7